MNLAHDILCASRWWGRRVERDLVPWGLDGVELGSDVLEVGPGFGATTRVLARPPIGLTVLEPEPRYCARLRHELGDRIDVVHGDGVRMPFPDGRFSGVVCFTMLHHVPGRELQDRLLGEVSRVLAPAGVFAGTDSLGQSLVFRAIHVGDDLELVDPEMLPARLESAGLSDPRVQKTTQALRFWARKPR